MSTNAFVGNKADIVFDIKLRKEIIVGSYIHWDGDPEGAGNTLQEAWATEERLRELLAMGDMSILGSKLSPTGAHDFDHPEFDVCLFYHRDRNEPLNHATIHFDRNKNRIKAPKDSSYEYYYLFVKGIGYEIYDRSGKYLKTLYFHEKDAKDTVRVWARVGMMINIPKEQLLDFALDMEGKIGEYFEQGRACFDGEIYLPDEVSCEQNDLVNYITDKEFELQQKKYWPNSQ